MSDYMFFTIMNAIILFLITAPIAYISADRARYLTLPAARVMNLIICFALSFLVALISNNIGVGE